MSAEIIDGKAVAAAVRSEVAEGVTQFRAKYGRAPGLVGIQVGDDPASELYQAGKARAADEVGMVSRRITLPDTTSQAELDALIDELNADGTVDGMLVQLPVPAHLSEPLIANRIHPDKDVDGFSPVNLGRLMRGEPGNVPCTPQGVMRLLRDGGVPLEGAHAVVIGRSLIVGKPQSMLLLQTNCTVTVAHSRTRDLAQLCRQADILVAAVGQAEMVRADYSSAWGSRPDDNRLFTIQYPRGCLSAQRASRVRIGAHL
jgi:methylenetetrahydrofolate dehydrogenase (NADP+) / methenyltetrahydrofolate cyclohydrolase